MSYDGTFRLRDVATGKVLHGEPATDRRLPLLAFSPDGASNLLAIGGDRTIRLWDFARRARRQDDRGRGRAPSDEPGILAGRHDHCRSDGDWRNADPALACKRWCADQAVRQPGDGRAGPCCVIHRTERSWAGPDAELPPVSLKSQRGVFWSGSALARTARWRFHPMERRSRRPDEQQTLHFWDVCRRARTAWRLPKPTRAVSGPSHSSTTARRSSPAATTGPSGSGTWRRAGRPKVLAARRLGPIALGIRRWCRSLAAGSTVSGVGQGSRVESQDRQPRSHRWLPGPQQLIRGCDDSLGAARSMIAALSDGSLRAGMSSTGRNLPGRPAEAWDLGLDRRVQGHLLA